MSLLGLAPSIGLPLALLASIAGCASSPGRPTASLRPASSLENQAAVPRLHSLHNCSRRPTGDQDSTEWQVAALVGNCFPTGRQVRWQSFDIDPIDVIALAAIDEPETASRPDSYYAPEQTLWADVLADHANYYSRKSLGGLAVGIGVAAVVANTSIDESFRDFYQENVRNVRTDEYSEAMHTPKVWGNGYITIPAFGGAALAGSWFDDVPLGRGVSEWGQRSLRTVLVGGPPLLAMQVATGASRPGETSAGAAWKPFEDSNGVSGHSFMGAVPFLSVAKMTDDLFWKAAFYFGSTLPGLSRINDDRHYASQVMLGWWMAYVAANAVDQTQFARRNLNILPMPMADGVGLGIEYRR